MTGICAEGVEAVLLVKEVFEVAEVFEHEDTETVALH